jgi:hypothetical protein
MHGNGASGLRREGGGPTLIVLLIERQAQPRHLSLHDDRAAETGLAAIFSEKNATDRLFAGLRLGFRACPAFGAAPRLHLDAEQKRFLAKVQRTVGFGVDLSWPRFLRDRQAASRSPNGRRLRCRRGGFPVEAEANRM